MIKILENFTVNNDRKKKNCKKNELYNQVDANSVINLHYKNPMGGKKELALHIQLSFFGNVLNYVTDTIRICNSNHSRAESCTSGCIPLNLSKFNLNQFLLSERSYCFFLSNSLLSIDSFLNQEDKHTI